MNHESGPLLPRLKDDKVQGVLPHVYQKTHELRVGHGAPADLELLLVRAGAHDFQCVFIKGVVVLRKKAVTIGCAILRGSGSAERIREQPKAARSDPF